MAAINTLIKEINHILRTGNPEKAIALYKELLIDDKQEWKVQVIDKIIELVQAKGLIFLFSKNISDIVLIDQKNQQLLMIWILQEEQKEYVLYEYSTWMEETRSLIEEDTLDDLLYRTKALQIIHTKEENIEPEINDPDQDFYRISSKSINLDLLIPSEIHPLSQGDSCFDKELIKYSLEMCSQLADIDTPWPDPSVSKLAESNGETISKYNILETAPPSFIQFLQNSMGAVREKELKEIFSLSLHTVFVGDPINKAHELAEYFRDAITPPKLKENTPISISVYDILDTTDKNEYAKYLQNLSNEILIIENLDKQFTVNHFFKKSDLIRILIKELEKLEDKIVILNISKQAWDKLVLEYPLLRVYFQNIFHFEALKTEHLLNHLTAELQRHHLEIEGDAKVLITEFFNYTKQHQSPQLFDFPLSNMLAREARYYQASRSSNHKDKKIRKIIREDIEKAIKDEYILHTKSSLKVSLTKIDQLIGLENVKKGIRDLAALIRVNKLRNSHPTKSGTPISLNSLFVGHPGTGKTTVAKYLGEVYQSIGVLPKGHLVAVSRQDIVGKWIGHTEENMLQIIRRAQGGILFIDEAYSLYLEDTDRDFGRDAINVLVDQLEEIKDHTCVILAGYPEPMKKFLNSNPGLASRIPHTLNFQDYQVNELNDIFKLFMQLENFHLEKDAEVILLDILEVLHKNKDEHFGNARTCRNLFEQLKLIQAHRITYSEDKEIPDLYAFTAEDLQTLKDNPSQPSQIQKRQKLGFRIS